jgi:hypothetical protein
VLRLLDIVARAVQTYLEIGAKRTFAGAIDWPGWTRSGRDENAALQALIDYGSRYATAVGTAARGFHAPNHPSDLQVVERTKGNASTDFGAPSIAPSADQRPAGPAELRRQIALLKASWAAVARSAKAAAGVTLKKGPRGGGRELGAILRHVAEAEESYLHRLGGTYQRGGGTDVAAGLKRLRAEILDLLTRRVDGEPIPLGKRTAPLWAPRYFVRRTAWHALDHAWEIEDRSAPAG